MGKNSGPILSRLWTKVHSFETMEETSTHLTNYLYRVSFLRYRPLKFQLSCKVVEKGGFGAPICRGGMPHISDMHFKTVLTSEHVAGFGQVPFSELLG